MKKALIYSVVFIAIQMMVSSIVQGIWMLVYGKELMMNATGMVVTMAVFSLLTMAVFLLARWSEVSRHWVRTRPWTVLIWCVVAALGAIIPSVWFQEHLPELPNIVEGEFDMILRDRWGYVVIGLLAPLAEEMVFRGAVLRALLHSRRRPWVAIAISALLFALIHMNPAQMPHAFLIGLLLGWLYYRTDSIVPGVVYHWVNNTVAYVLYNLYPDPDLTLAQLFGSERTVLMALAFSFCILLPAIFQLNLRLRK